MFNIELVDVSNPADDVQVNFLEQANPRCHNPIKASFINLIKNCEVFGLIENFQDSFL